MKLLEIQDLTKNFGGLTAVHSLHMSIETGQSRITKSKLRFPFLKPKNVTPNWKGMTSRMAFIRMHWRPYLSDKYNWATPNGLMMYSRYRETEMMNNMVDFYRITRTEQSERDRHELGEAGARGGYMSPLDYVRYIDTEVSRTFGIVKGLTPKEGKKLDELEAGSSKVRYDRLESMSNEELHEYMKIIHNSMTETQRAKYLNSYVNQVEDFISTRFRDIAGLYEMTRVYHALDMDGVLARRIIAGVTDTKEMYDRYSSELLYGRKLEYIARKKKWSPERLAAEVKAMEERSEELHAQHGTPDAVKSRIERLIDRLAYNLPDVNKGRTKNLTA